MVDAAQTPFSLRVLLIDDNADSREMHALMLAADGHEVYQAGNGPEALDTFRRLLPHVAIVDIGLPGMDGYELAKQIRAEPSGGDVMLIALTGYGFPEDRERSDAAGFTCHLVKPVTPDDLRHHLAGHAGNEPGNRGLN
jgi:CheY-like chemotaxis protein